MAVTINASASSSGLVTTADGSGYVKLQSNGVTTNTLLWINFGYSAGTVTRSSYNVSSTTRNSTGVYTFVPVVSMTDANYCVNASAGVNDGASNWCSPQLHFKSSGTYYTAPTSSSFIVGFNYGNSAGYVVDPVYGNISVVGN